MARGASDLPSGVRPLTVGDPVMIGRHLLLGRLGVGGMGIVYLAEPPGGGFVALKTPHAPHLKDPTLRARFAEEVAFSRRMVPFCTAAVIEDGVDGDRPYLVTEYLPGPALSQVIAARGALTPDLAYGVALGAVAALVAVHDAALVHRDLKPGNVLLSPRGPRVIDFGIARDVDTLFAHTQAGQVMGSHGWVAPECLTGGPAVPASDVFAWGCLVAFAATGHHPFGGGEPDELARRILFEEPRVASVPGLLRPAVVAALAKDAADRPKAADLLRALLAGGGVGEPGDLRAAVGGVLEEIWSAVPYPAGGGRVRDGIPAPGGRRAPDRGAAGAAGAAGVVVDRRAVEVVVDRGPVVVAPVAPARTGRARRRRRVRSGAHLAHAGLAALATVSIAAVTVFTATGGEGLSIDGGVRPPDEPRVVWLHATTGSARRPPASRTADAPAATPTVAAPTAAVPTPGVREAATPTAPVTRTRGTAPFAVVGPPLERHATKPPPDDDPVGVPGGEEPGACVNRPRTRRGRPDCPRPSVSISTIPQDGPGESPGPSASDPATPTATAAPTS
ncbi:protein kinase domain-containing protein [Nonomuraea sp. ZG12]|uniref:protein kinase domain-containing protein n=1 Tax=Nonomuraea sp. ZG12 TaxID=3452207 RepID=UPI003F8C1D55